MAGCRPDLGPCGGRYDLTSIFLSQYLSFPFGRHDNLIDAISRIYDTAHHSTATPPIFYRCDLLLLDRDHRYLARRELAGCTLLRVCSANRRTLTGVNFCPVVSRLTVQSQRTPSGRRGVNNGRRADDPHR